MKEKFFTLLALSFLLFSGNAQAAFEAERFFSCEAMKVPLHIVFKTAYGQLVHDVSTEEKQLQGIKKSQTVPEKLFLNSSHNTIQTDGYVKLSSAITEYISKENICLIPEEIEVFIGYKDPLIYIAKEFRSKPCEFSVMLRHQQIHQQINIYTLQYLLPLMKDAIIQATQNINPIVIQGKGSANQGIKKLQNEYIAAVKPILDAFDQIREQEHRKFDEVTSYKIDEKLCQSYNRRREKALRTEKDPH